MSNFDITVLINAWSLFVFVYSVFILVAIWRSARNYKRQHSDKTWPAGLAQSACVLGSLVLCGSVAERFLSNDSNNTESLLNGTGDVDTQLQRQALIAGLNANLPRKLDSVTTLTKIDINADGFQYNETISTALDNNDAFIGRMRLIMIKRLCAEKDVRDNLERKINYQYNYFDDGAKPIGTVRITKSDCG